LEAIGGGAERRWHAWNANDNCPNDWNPSQANSDSDSLGDACDPDDDNDGRSDVEEIRDGTDPLQQDCAPDEYPNSTFNIILMIEARKAAQEKLE
jgi:hypothetical protein